MDRREGADPFAELKEASEEYKVYDSHYEKIGKVDDLIVDEDERVMFVGVKMGFFGTNSTLVPVELARINDRRRLIEVGEPAEAIKHAPHFGRSEELTPELENHVRSYYGLDALQTSPEHGAHDPYSSADYPTEERFGPDGPVDREPGERASTQGRSMSASEGAEEGIHEGRDREERPAERRPEREPADEREGPISERLSEEPEGIVDRLRTGGVTVHRIRR